METNTTTNTIAELLTRAERSLRTADHMVYITYPLIKENLLLKKILEELNISATSTIQAIINYESLYKRISIQEPKASWLAFKEKCAPRFNISQQEIQIIVELLSLAEKYKSSAMDFIRKDRLVIMNDNLRTETVNLDQLKKYLGSVKVLLLKTKTKIQQERIS